MVSRTAAPMVAQGPRKGEPSLPSMRHRLRPQPARLVRGSSRRIMSMRFRPANIRVINRRASSSAIIGPAVPKECEAVPSIETAASAFAPLRMAPLRLRRLGEYSAVDRSLHIRSSVGEFIAYPWKIHSGGTFRPSHLNRRQPLLKYRPELSRPRILR